MTITLRPYQVEAVHSVRQAWRNGVHSQLVAMATGLGKTEVLLSILAEERAEHHLSRALVIAHRKELIEQPAERIALHWTDKLPTPGIVMAERNECNAQIVIATIQTLGAAGRLEQLLRAGAFSHVIVDEAHHAVATSYLDVITALRVANPHLYLLGVTATPKRTDGAGLKRVFERVAFRATIKDGIGKYKALSPFLALGVQLPVDISQVEIRGEDYDPEQLGSVLDTNNAKDLIIETWKKHASDRQTMVFTASVAQARGLAQAFRDAGIAAAWASGETPKPQRAQIINDFKAGLTQVVVNCLDAKTEILTRRGWIGIDAMRMDDESASYDIESEQIKWEPITRIVRRPREANERMVCISNQGLDIRVTEGHRLIVRDRGGERRIVTAGELPTMSNPYSIPLSGFMQPETIERPDVPERYANVGRRSATRYMLKQQGHSVATIEADLDQHAIERRARQYKTPAELTLAECEFIGLVITDGHVNKGGRGVVISASDYYPEVQAEIARILTECGFDWAESKIKTSHTSYNKPTTHDQRRFRVAKGLLGGELQAHGYWMLEPYLDKDFSPLLFGLDAAQTLALVHGLWLGDGIKDDRKKTGSKSWTIVSANPTLNDRLQKLCVSRGLATNVSKPRDNGPEATKPIFTVGIRAKTELQTNNASVITSGGNPAHFEDGWAREQVWCITNQTGTIITRRNGKVAIMGQCALWTEGFDAPSIACIAMVRPTRSDTVYTQAIGRGLRLAAGKTDCLILDFQPLGGRDLIMAGDLLGKPQSQKKREAKALSEGTISEAFGIDSEGMGIDGDPDDVITRALDLFAQSKIQWTYDGAISTAGIGGNLSLAIVSPQLQRIAQAEQMQAAGEWRPDWELRLQQLRSYQVFAIGDDRQPTALGSAGNWDDAVLLANEYADEHGDNTLAKRTASWRHSPPSDKQKDFAIKLGCYRSNMSRGACAQAITHSLALQQLRRARVLK